MTTYPHLPVLIDPLLQLLQQFSLSFVVDGTVGAGGHSCSLLQEHKEISLLLGIDKDPDALQIAEERLRPWKEKVQLVQGSFDFRLSNLAQFSPSPPDLILLDLGVSSMQLDRAEKGFSFMRDGPLDMRMDPSQTLTAAEIVNEWDELAIGKLFRDLGEEVRWRGAARTLISARQNGYISTTKQLVEILEPVLRQHAKKKIHPLTKVFQALRIAVNGELEALKKGISNAMAALPAGGVLAVITFHSLEDRIVKQAFQYAASDKMETSSKGTGLFLDKKPEGLLLTRKPIVATEEEIKKNGRSRSARLRAIKKI